MKASPDDDDNELDEDIAAAVSWATVAALDIGERVTIDEEDIVRAAQDDPAYQLLRAKVTDDTWHERRSQEMECLRPFYNVRDRLGTTGEIVTYAFDDNHLRLVIPEALRRHLATKLHAGY